MSNNNIGCLELVLASMLGTFLVIGGCGKISKISKKLDELASQVQNMQQERFDNVIGSSLNDRYYIVNGRKAFIEIDGKPVEEYFQEKAGYSEK
jgi:hypothetical protein